MPYFIALVDRAKAFFREMTENILMVYAEKGIEPFKKPLLFALPVVLIIYIGVYSPLGARLGTVKRELEKVRVISSSYGDFSDAKTRLAEYQRKLPLLKDKEEWLNYVMTSTAKTQGISFDSLSVQSEIEAGGFLVVSREVSVLTTYAKFGKWVADIESSPILLKVADVAIKKEGARAGWIRVNMKLSTIFAKAGLAERE